MKIDLQTFGRKKLIFSFFAVILMSALYRGQRHEVGVQFGMSNLVGDIGRTNYVLQKPFGDFSRFGLPFYGGVLYRMNFNPYQTLRFNIGYSHIQFADGGAKERYRNMRKLWGTNSIVEADAIFEYNFFPVNEEQRGMVSPYIFAGLGAMFANTPQVRLEHDFYRDAAGNAQTPITATDFDTRQGEYQSVSQLSMAVPFGVGLKYKFNYNWAIFGEFMFRPTFSDSIDYNVIDENNVQVSYNKDIPSAISATRSLLQDAPYREVAEARAADFIQGRSIGNINSKDWVNSMTLGVSYSFGRPPCYCGE